MSHKFRFSLVAALALLAMFMMPQITMAAPFHSSASAQAGAQSAPLHQYTSSKQYYSSDEPEHSADEDSSSWQSLFWWRHERERHIKIHVDIDCDFFSCNIHSFNDNHIDIHIEKENHEEPDK